MSQVNIRSGGPPIQEEPGGRIAADGVSLAVSLIVLSIVVVMAWLVFSNPVSAFFRGGATHINVNTPGDRPAQTPSGHPTAAPGLTNPSPDGPSSKP